MHTQSEGILQVKYYLMLLTELTPLPEFLCKKRDITLSPWVEY